MTDRRTILKASLLAPALLARPASAATPAKTGIQMKLPCVVSTWPFGVAANKAAWTVLSKGGRAVDAVETGVKIPEADLRNHTVGRAGYPDRDGHVTLDACIMDEKGNAGSVAGMEHIAHPISVARLVMASVIGSIVAWRRCSIFCTARSSALLRMPCSTSR